jgi:hypothetical protein
MFKLLNDTLHNFYLLGGLGYFYSHQGVFGLKDSHWYLWSRYQKMFCMVACPRWEPDTRTDWLAHCQW